MSPEILPYGEPLTEEEAAALGVCVEDAITERDALDASVEVAIRPSLYGGVEATAPLADPARGVETQTLERFLERVRTALLTGGTVHLVEVAR